MADPGTPGGYDPEEAARIARLEAMRRAAGITIGTVDPRNPLGVGATPASLGASGSAAVQRATGSAPNSPETDAALGVNTSPSVQTALGSAPNSPATNTALGVSSAPTQPYGGFDMAALRRAAADAAAQADAANAANASGTTGQTDISTTNGSLGSIANTSAATSGSLGATTKPPTDDRTTSNLLAQMTTQSNVGTRAAGTGASAGAGVQDQGAGSGTIDQGASGGGLGALTNSILGQLQGIGQSLAAPGNAPDVGGVFMQQAQGLLKLLDEQEKQMRADAEKQGTVMDPATQVTLDKIREGLEDNLKTTREDLNRRGVYDSGITLDLEGKLRKGSASDQAMILASRLSKLQDELTKGLSSIRSQKVSTLSDFGGRAAQAQFTSDENSRRQAYDREQNALQAMLNLRSQFSSENNQAANRQFQGQESALERAYNAEQRELDRQYGDAQNKARTAAEFEANKYRYEQESALIAQRNAGSGGGSTARATTSRASGAQNTQGTGDVTSDAIADMRSVFSTTQEAVNAIREQQRELQDAGVDLAQLYEAANGLGRRRAGTSDY